MGEGGRKEKGTQDDAKVGNVPRLGGGFCEESHGAVLCHLHVCYRYSFACIEYYIKHNFKKSHSSELKSRKSSVPLNERDLSRLI